MMGKISGQQSIGKILVRFMLEVFDIIVDIASETPRRLRYCPAKAQELYDDNAISGNEYAKCIYGE